jgi:hypothetical protein
LGKSGYPFWFVVTTVHDWSPCSANLECQVSKLDKRAMTLTFRQILIKIRPHVPDLTLPFWMLLGKFFGIVLGLKAVN